MILILEGMSRLVYAYQDELSENLFFSFLARGELILDPYEMASPTAGGHWVLRPNFPYANTPANAGKIRRSPWVRLQTNKHGFRGPDIDEDHSRIRILSLGDSVTFGIRKMAYPRIVEDVLKEAGIPVEVINAGVEGYAPRNLLYEISRYVSLQPELVTIYIGWNALYSPSYWLEENQRCVRFLWFVKNVSRNLYRRFIGEEAYAKKLLARTPLPNAYSEQVMYSEKFTPSFLGKIEKIIDHLEAGGSRVFLLTLPALFVSDEKPTMKALKIGHLPAFTVNPYVLAKITERYNQSLRDMASRRGLGLIDLAVWSKHHMVPRDEFFSDSVHLTGEGLVRVGNFVADQLKKTIGKGPVK